MKSIERIQIENVKGIQNETFEISLLPFMPHFFVAPNGFGKTSIATAFDSLNRDRVKLEEKNCHLGNVNSEPVVKISCTDNNNNKLVLAANSGNNDISKVFQIEVIRSLLRPEANLRKFKNFHVTSPSIEIDSIYIIENIPDKFELPYQVTKFRSLINDNRQVWADLSELLKNRAFINKLENLNVLDKFDLVKQTTLINSYKETVKSIVKTREEVIADLNANHLSILTNEFFNRLVEVVEQFQTKSKAESILTAIQVIELYKSIKEDFKKLCIYKRYCSQKERILTLFKAFKATWKGVTPKEINITRKHKGKIIITQKNFGIEFPKASDISNGERDVVCFIGSLLRAQQNFRGKPTILIIDEVFDYLDDANLIAVQFYITKFIEFFQNLRSPVAFFPIILTHLNPYYFKNYFFSNQKVSYLSAWKGQVDRAIESLVISRNNTLKKEFADNLSSFFLHFNPSDHDITEEAQNEFATQKLNNFNAQICISADFKAKIFEYFNNYLNGKKNYDPISVCIATRLIVEEKVYSQIPAPLQQDFINTHTTVAKFDFVREKTDVVIPETYYFLGTIYNELLHLRKNQDNSSPIFLKLNNLTIKKMIKELR